jgi:hypothetical protein
MPSPKDNLAGGDRERRRLEEGAGRTGLPAPTSPAPGDTDPEAAGDAACGDADPSAGRAGARAMIRSWGHGDPPTSSGGGQPGPFPAAAVDHWAPCRRRRTMKREDSGRVRGGEDEGNGENDGALTSVHHTKRWLIS